MRKLAGLVLAAAVFALQAIPASAAFEAYVVIHGQKQGKTKGEALQQPPGLQPTLELTYAAQSPRDVSTGQPLGRRMHKPFTIMKEWGSASPQLGQAALLCRALVVRVSVAGGPALPAVQVPGAPGVNTCRYRVELPGASPVRVHVFLDPPPGGEFALSGNSFEAEADPRNPLVVGVTCNGQDAAGRFRLTFTHAATVLPPAVLQHLK